MDTKRKIIALSIVFGIILCLGDTLIDFLVFHSGTFWEIMLFKMMPHQIYHRASVLIIPILFGLFLAGIISRNEQRLQKTQQKYHGLFNSIRDAIFVHDLEGHFMDVNQAACQRYGYSRDEFLDMSLMDLDTPEHAAKISSNIKKIKETGQAIFESAHQCADSKIIDVEINAQLIEYKNELAILSTARDITERKQTEEVLKRQARMLDAVEQAVITTNAAGQIEYMNKAAEDLYGWKFEEVQGANIVEVTPTKSSISEAQKILEMLKKGQSWQGEFLVQNKAGEQFYTHVTDTPIMGRDGELRGIIGISYDNTERRQARQALEWQQEVEAAIADLSKGLLESIPIEDISFRVLEYAKTLTDSAFGYVGYIDPETGHLICPTMTRDIWDQCQIPNKDVVFKAFGGLWGWVLENRQTLMTNALKDDPRSTGTPQGHLPIERFLSAPAMIGEELVGQIALANPGRNYTKKDFFLVERLAALYALALQRKRAEDALAEYSHRLEDMVDERTEELRDAQEKLLRQERLSALGQLAGSIAHDLRNPLSVIASSVYYLKIIQEDAEETVGEYLDMIDDEVKTANRIISDLLDFARDKTVIPNPINIDEIVQYILKRNSPPEQITVDVQIPEELPQAHMDRGHLQQILTNLIINAYQAIDDEGQVTISGSQNEDQISLVVQDTGMGIPAKNMEKIFEPLFTTKSNGIGLGLSICQKLIRANHGSIKVSSQEGAGSSFVVMMPIHQDG